jgi:sugar phosphate isomerase/epimerase
MAITGLSCADFGWPLLEHRAVLRLISELGFDAVDLGFFADRSHIRPEIVRDDVAWWAGCIHERLDQLGLKCADVFFAPSTLDMRIMAPNSTDPDDIEAGRALFLSAIEFASRIQAPGISINSGVYFSGESAEESLARSAEGLRWRVDQAGERGLVVSIEGAVGTNTDTPSKLRQLLELVPGLYVTLDYTHYASQGFEAAEIEPLLERARHIHIRGGGIGAMQSSFSDNEIDYARVVRAAQEFGYKGYLALEYVWTTLWDCNRVDNTMETIQFRDFFRTLLDEPKEDIRL